MECPEADCAERFPRRLALYRHMHIDHGAELPDKYSIPELNRKNTHDSHLENVSTAQFHEPVQQSNSADTFRERSNVLLPVQHVFGSSLQDKAKPYNSILNCEDFARSQENPRQQQPYLLPHFSQLNKLYSPTALSTAAPSSSFASPLSSATSVTSNSTDSESDTSQNLTQLPSARGIPVSSSLSYPYSSTALADTEYVRAYQHYSTPPMFHQQYIPRNYLSCYPSYDSQPIPPYLPHNR